MVFSHYGATMLAKICNNVAYMVIEEWHDQDQEIPEVSS